MTATTLDTNRKSSGFTLSGGNLIATSTAGATAAATRSQTGKHYAEFTITTLTGTPVVGFTGYGFTYNTQLLGVENNGLGYRSGGAVVLNNVTLATLAAYVAGDRIDMALNPNDKLVWFRVNGGNWNNNVLNDPVTGVGGIDFSTMNLGSRLFPAVGSSLTGTVWTCKFSAAFTGTPPTGYASFDDVQLTVGRQSAIGEGVLDVLVDWDIFSGNGKQPRELTDGTEFVSGILQEVGTPTAGKTVRLYDQATGEILDTDVTAGDGSFSLNAKGKTLVYVIALDSPYNAKIFSDVVPVP